MVTVSFTKFRQKATSYIDAVEKGETIQVLRHGKVVARVVPPVSKQPSWKTSKPFVIPGLDFSKAILKERRLS